MLPGRQLISPQQSSGDLADWRSICAELESKLPGEIVEIEGKRLRIEAVIAKLDIGDVVRDLSIAALTPRQKHIVRYELDTAPSGPLASNLAAIISRAKDKNTPAESVIQSIQACLHSSGPHFFRKIEPERNPFALPSMERNIPDFEKFARDPFAMDTHFSVDREINGTRVRATATLFPQQRYALIEAFEYPNGDAPIPPAYKFKARCPANFFEQERSTEEVIMALHTATWAVMETIVGEGSIRACRHFPNREIDQRLYRGVVAPATCDTMHTLPSGARVMLEEGDSIVCVRIESSVADDSSSFFWRITSTHGLLLESDPKLITVRSAVESLVASDSHRRQNAIQTLDRLEHSPSNRLPQPARRIAPFNTPTLEQIIGYELAESITSLPKITVEAVTPNSLIMVLDLLDGMQCVKLSFRDPEHSRLYPQDPNTMFIGFRSDGGLKITLTSPLRNHLETFVPPNYFTRHNNLQSTVTKLAELFNHQTRAGFEALRREIENLDHHAHDETFTNIRPARTKYPSIDDSTLNSALDTAADIALIYEVDAPSSISEVQVAFDDGDTCEMIVSNLDATPPLRMHLKISEVGVHGIDLYSADLNHQRSHPFSLRTPLTIPEGRNVLTQIFKLLHTHSEQVSSANKTSSPALSSTLLFKYLKECEERFTLE